MNIGLVDYRWTDAQASLVHVAYTTATALAQAHDLQPYPPEYQFARPARQRELLKQWMARCDVILGSVEGPLLRARDELARRTPYACLLLGTLSRGGGWLIGAHQHLRTCDILIGNCEADVALAKKFFPNATVRCMPLAYDEAQYYPASDDECAAVRTSLGVDPDEPLIVYAGRITLEKNLHTLLKTFRVVLNAIPNARLVIAGADGQQMFAELGTRAIDLRRTLERLIARWHLGERVLFAGHRDAGTLRALYSTAHVLVNMSLNHDENFGLVQIEAMACGLPAVVTAWGGFKDTVRDGVTGALVPTVWTDVGIKVDWWRAATSIIELIAQTDRRERMHEHCLARARGCYALARYARALDAIVRECQELASGPVEPLQPSAFAQDYWQTCFGRHAAYGSKPPYRRGPEAWALYGDLIRPFAGMPPSDAVSAAMSAWCLPAPLVMSRDGTIAVNDPLYPLEVAVPPPLVRSTRRLIDVFTRQPVIDDETLANEAPAIEEALTWMQATGLVLRTQMAARHAPFACGALGQPAFTIRNVDHDIDLLVVA